jgi:hypothetical protein
VEHAAYRVLAGIFGLAVAVASACVLVVALGVVEPAQISLGVVSIEGWLTNLAEATFTTRLAFGAGAPVVGLLALVVTTRAFGGRKRGDLAVHILDSDDRGFVVVDSRGIAIVAEEAAHTAPGVVAAHVGVEPRGAKRVKLHVEIDVYPGANVKEAGNEARDRARKAVEELVGVDVGAITASTHVLEPEEMARVLL